MDCAYPDVFAGFLYVEDVDAAVDDGCEDGAGKVRDLNFAGVEGRVVRWEGIWAFEEVITLVFSVHFLSM